MPTKHLTGLDILVVEDESLPRKQIAAQLESLGADVTRAGTLQAARQSLANFSFDFALLDVNLPDGRGTALLEEKVFPNPHRHHRDDGGRRRGRRGGGDAAGCAGLSGEAVRGGGIAARHRPRA